MKAKSERLLLAERLAQFVIDNGMTKPYGGDVTLSPPAYGGRHYSFGMSMPRLLDGTVQVFSPSFILIRYMTQFRALPDGDARVFTSEKHALDFLRLAFVERDFQKALEVPTK